MSTTLESSNATSLQSVQQAFEHWRRSRTQRSVTPMELRHRAVSLMAHHRRGPICKALRINDQALKQWAGDSGRANHGSMIEHQRREPCANGRFVELPTHKAHSSDAISGKPVTAIRIELPNGAVIRTDQAFTLEQILWAACVSPEPGA